MSKSIHDLKLFVRDNLVDDLKQLEKNRKEVVSKIRIRWFFATIIMVSIVGFIYLIGFTGILTSIPHMIIGAFIIVYIII